MPTASPRHAGDDLPGDAPPPPFSVLPPAGLRSALARAARSRDVRRTPAHDAEWAALEGAVGAYARACRDAGLPPEAALIAVKAAAAAAGMAPRGSGGDGGALAAVVQWCIRAYYHAA